ncbi:MAG: Ig-like domain-containing protein, partial [Dehalococcoidia bacterium]
YFCEYHQNKMFGTFIVQAVNTAPTIDLTTPDGGEVWTAGTTRTIWWNMSDAEDAPTALKVWLNYSLNSGATYSPIPGAQGISGLTCPCTFEWTTPTVDSTSALVKAAVVDTGDASASDVSTAAFTLDATAPSVIGTTPANGTTGVPPTTTIEVTFSEAMNQFATQQAFSLRREDTGAYISGTFSWAGPTMTFTPTSALPEGVPLTGRVNATALDASDPGNPLPSIYTFSFTTADTVPPTIENVTATPPLQESGGSVNITASVTDNGIVAGAWVEVTDPNSILLGNFSMAWDAATGLHYYTAVYQTTGLYSFQVAASDGVGNWNATNGSFMVQDTTPPSIEHTPPPGAVVGLDIYLAALVDDNDVVAEVRVNYTDILGVTTNATMVLSGSLYTYTIPAQNQTGTVEYFLWAVDPGGNEARTDLYSISVSGSDAVPPTISSVNVDPPVQDVSLPTNISASVTDNVGIGAVYLNVTDPFGATVGNFSMTKLGVTSTYFAEGTYTVLGNYTFIIWAFDLVGNSASASGSFDIIDSLPPTLGIPTVTPSPQEVGQTVEFSVSVTDNYQMDTVNIEILDPDGFDVGNFTMTLVDVNYTYSASFDKPGVYSFTIWAKDALNNYASATGQFTVQDATRPVVGTPTATPSPQEIGQLVSFSVVVTDNYQVEMVTIAIEDPDGNLVGNFTMTLVDVNYTYSASFDKPGVYSFTIWASDTSGLRSSASGQFEIRDTEPPAIAHTPAAFAVLGKTLNLTATVTDNDVVAEVKLNWTDETGSNENATMSSSGDTYWLVLPMRLRPGTLSYFLWARDAAGNEARTAALSLEVQAPAGVIVLYGSLTGGWGFGPDNITIPGPTIEVQQGATVDLLLIGVDASIHNFYVDYDGDAAMSGGEPVSSNFRSNSTQFSFVADRVGSFTYYCVYHQGTMYGTFVVSGETPPPEEPTEAVSWLPWFGLGFGIGLVAGILVAFVAMRSRPR